ncbi:MAG: amidohydrolase [Melioribacteraceae bacterium]|nr:amidohydrolase [Melioribacteraceae bacterium]
MKDQLLKSQDKSKLVSLRKELHRNPELAHNEAETAKLIIDFISKNSNPDEIITEIAGNGILFIFKGENPAKGRTLLFRAELDALPIKELNQFEYMSRNSNISHKCGHDGHMTILSALAILLKQRPKTGKVLLLFQPAEEIGEGAELVLNDSKFKNHAPDYVFALHNLPGYKIGTVILRTDVFACASTGMKISLTGKTSHAAEPENGVNPAYAVSEILDFTRNYATPTDLSRVNLITPIFLNLGNENAFGTNAGDARIYFTIRSTTTKDFSDLKLKFTEYIRNKASDYNLRCEIDWTEEFPNTLNDADCVSTIEAAISKIGLNQFHSPFPFRWSEDFGHFTHKFPGALFGLGSGEDFPNLHNPDYDFPDELIEIGARIFAQIVNEYLNQSS